MFALAPARTGHLHHRSTFEHRTSNHLQGASTMATNMTTRSDADITADVLAELAWDPAVTVADLDVVTSNGYVTLAGTTATYSSKDAAEDAAYRVFGVRDVTNDIVVDPAALGIRTDAAIQADVSSVITLDTRVPLD